MCVDDINMSSASQRYIGVYLQRLRRFLKDACDVCSQADSEHRTFFLYDFIPVALKVQERTYIHF